MYVYFRAEKFSFNKVHVHVYTNEINKNLNKNTRRYQTKYSTILINGDNNPFQSRHVDTVDTNETTVITEVAASKRQQRSPEKK